MSIPPLVCSTPPPPDQCEDDKDPEDFDLSYSLSQEDDDENNDYDYGNFSTYNHYQSSTTNKPLEVKDKVITTSVQSEVPTTKIFSNENSETEQTNVNQHVTEINEMPDNKLKCEEDINIEDLNLQVDEDITTSTADNSDENESSEQNADSLKDFNIPCNSNNSSQDDDVTNVTFSDNVIETTPHEEISIDNTAVTESSNFQSFALESDEMQSKENKPEFISAIEELTIDTESEIQDPEFPVEYQKSLKQLEAEVPEFPLEFQQSVEQLEAQTNDDDDFGDFDDFQFVNTKTTTVITVVDSSNPWENTESNETDFGNFTANFEENKIPVQDALQETVPVTSDEQIERETEPESNIGDDDDDDFGDFEDFKSPTADPEPKDLQEEVPCENFSVLNLQSTDNEHHIMETITKVITSVFLEEISTPESEFEGKLESFMGETWGHLRETDERQPYIVNWNNSLGQKTLLKALCIDSRNILFGPKWSSHSSYMPKYAANLSNAPLQPQKQPSASSYPAQSEAVPDKTPSKPTTWSDPFTSDGQESCNTENETSTVTPRPTDLDVFEAAIASKSEKIYSSTIGVQPIRQISLPDTHIFTPTDSEIPRSKTIHYDQSPAVLLPQPLVADSKKLSDAAAQNITDLPQTNSENDYWEFQDYKSTSDSVSLPGSLEQTKPQQEKAFETASIVNALPKPTIAYQTDLLQPIKVEPSMPTLNWPDPGEVKVAYDDFSDFVSITPQSSERQEPIQSMELPPVFPTKTNQSMAENPSDLNEKIHTVFVESKNTENENIDDDFDTFQSAAPAKSVSGDFSTNTFVNSSNQVPLHQFNEFERSSPKMNSIKSDTISFESVPRSKEASIQNFAFSNTLSSSEVTGNKSLYSSTQPNLLQPTPAGIGVVNQRTTGQILQPLSLESYSQINWPSPGIDLQDLSRFNPVETLQSLKSDLSVSGVSKGGSPIHTQKNPVVNHSADDDVWGEFVSSKPKQQQSLPKKQPAFVEDDEWTDFISSPSVKPQNGLNTISLNVHTNSSMQKSAQTKFTVKSNQTPVDIPALNYITPKANSHKSYSDRHFQNL